MSAATGASNYAEVHAKNRNVMPTSLPSNLYGDNLEQKPQFNSIGYYGDLLGRLNNQIETVEDVYKKTFYVQQQ